MAELNYLKRPSVVLGALASKKKNEKKTTSEGETKQGGEKSINPPRSSKEVKRSSSNL